MEELLHELGVDLNAVLIQAIGFFCVFLILRKYLFGRIGRVLSLRREEVETRLRTAEEREAGAKELTHELEKRLQGADEEVRVKIRQGEEDAQRRREEILAQARSEAAAEIERGRREIEWERQQTLADLREIVSDLTVAATEKFLETALDAEGQRRIVDRLIDRIPANSKA